MPDNPNFLTDLWAATDNAALAAALFPNGRLVRGDEWAAECPFCHSDEKDPRFSVSLTSTKSKCFKCDETGNLLTLAKALWGKLWRQEWALACPSAAEVLGNPGAPPRPQTGGSKRKKPSPVADVIAAAVALTNAPDSPGKFGPLSEAWRIPTPALLSQGVLLVEQPWGIGYGFVARDPATGEATDLKVRRLPPIPDGEPKSKSLAGSRAGLFGVESLKAKPSARVLVVEGEKKWALCDYHLPSHAVVGIGMGAGCWVDPVWTEALRGRDVTLLHDYDSAGAKGALKAADFLLPVAASVRRPTSIADDVDRDIGDVLLEEGGPARARAILDSAPLFAPAFDPIRFMSNRIAGELEAADGKSSAVDWKALGEEAFSVLVRAGAKFILIDGSPWCVYTGSLMKCSGRDPDWARLMLDLTGYTTVSSEGRIIREVISVRAGMVSVEPIVSPAWAVYHGGAVYVNLSNQRGSQVRISADSIVEVDNGCDGVITVPNENVSPIELMPDSAYDHNAALDASSKMASYFATDESSREFLRWYLLTMFLYPLAQTHPVVRFRGDSASGKSTCAKALTVVLYGAPYLISSTQAALYRSARRRPLTAIDNLEERDFSRDPELQNFVLVSATGRAREKSARDTDGGVVREEVKSLFLSTGIEPCGNDKPEIVNRTVEVTFNEGFGTAGFYEHGYLQHLVEERTMILNCAMRIAQDTLRDVAAGKLQRVMKTFPPNKRRLSEFFCLMSLAQTGGEQVNDLVLGWTNLMGEEERKARSEGNPVVPVILSIPKMADADMGTTCQRTASSCRTEFMRTGELFRVLSVVAKQFGLRNPYANVDTMSTRLGGETAKSLEEHGIFIHRKRTADSRLVSVEVRATASSPDLFSSVSAPGS